jgi:diguanylate cyclase (GGDEF)-like protein/PAS domain S-box-containing protein
MRSSAFYLAAALIPLFWLVYFAETGMEKNRAIVDAEARATNVTLVYEQHLDSLFLDLDHSLLLLRALYEKDPANFDLKYWVQQAGLISPTVVRFNLIDLDGFQTQTTVAYSGPPVYLGDRQQFLGLAGSAEDAMRITAVANGRVVAGASIKVARRLRSEGGRFAGVIVASVDPSALVRFFGTAKLGAHGTVALRNSDLRILAADGLSQNLIGEKSATPALESGLENGNTGSYWGGRALDGISRLVTFRRSETVPLVLVAGIAEDEIFAAFWRQRAIYRVMAAVLTLLLVAAVAWDLGRLYRLDEAHRAREELIERFQSATEHMPQGLSMFDGEQRLVAYNAKYLELYHLPAGEYHLGCSLKEFLEKRKASGGLGEEVEDYLINMRARHQSGATLQSIDTIVDGRIIHIVTHLKADGGWVSTHEDVTDRRHAEKELLSLKNFLDTIIQNIPMPILIKDAHTHRVLLVNRAYASLHGLQKEKIIGASIPELFPEALANRIAADDVEALNSEDGKTSVEFFIDTPEHGRRAVLVERFVVRDENGGPEYIISLVQDVTSRKNNEAKINQLARYDPLTGLSNRSLFREQLEELLARQRQDGTPFAVFMLDLDRFKQVNDAHGHHIGDALLKAVAKRIRESVRENDVAARLGGDEFAVIAPGGRDDLQSRTQVLAERLVQVLSTPFDIEGRQVNIGCSIGIALLPAHGEHGDQLLRSADLALYKAKSSGRKRFCFYSEDLKVEADRRNELENDLRQAIWRDEFELFYQPVIACAGSRVVGVEALLRWRHPTRGLVSPGQFIPLAEESGLIVRLGEWVLCTACRDAKTMPENIKIAVNISPLQFSGSNLVDAIDFALTDAGLPAGRLEIEVTETVLLRDCEQNLETLRQLKRLGVSVALDDFGVGYSSLSYLTSFPFDKLKIDKSFIAKVGRRETGAVITSIVQLAKTLKLAICAEGVETPAQFADIRDQGIELCQGYLFGRPAPLAALKLDCKFAVSEQKVA